MPATLRPLYECNVVRVLSFHATYACRHAGACCESGWPIPVEADRLELIQRAIDAGTIRGGRAPGAPFEYPPDAPVETPARLAMTHGACVFRSDAVCEIHRAIGHHALPLACRQFPRVSLLDPRGVSSVTLSHFCPTARALLSESTQPVAIISNVPVFPVDAEYVGFDARAAMPPLLRPDMLMDWDSWWRWENRAVDLVANQSASSDEGLARLRIAVEHVRSWQLEEGALIDRIEEAFELASARPIAAPPWSRAEIACRITEVFDAVPHDLERPEPSCTETTRVEIIRLLAAHAFANWTAHVGQGLRTWLRSLEAVDALIASGFDVAQVDLLLRHLADPAELAKIWGEAERQERS